MVNKYPSQIRYEENNPSITFRMKKNEKNLICKMAEKNGVSISQLVRMSLLDLEKEFSSECNNAREEGKNEGYEIGFSEGEKLGYNKGKDDWAIWCFCDYCKKPKYIKPNSEDHRLLNYDLRWRVTHDQCPEQ